MADPRWRMKYLKNQANQGKFYIRGFFGSLIINLKSLFENFGIQDGGQTFWISTDLRQTLCGGIFWVADNEFAVTFWKFLEFQMANPRWRIKICDINWFIQNFVQGVFSVADYDSGVTFREFLNLRWQIQDGESKMPDENFKYQSMYAKSWLRGILGSWLSIRIKILENFGSNMVVVMIIIIDYRSKSHCY